MANNNVDFVVKNGLQVTSNITVGAYSSNVNVTPSSNGIVVSGNVGIGTSNPHSPLHVIGNIQIGTTTYTGSTPVNGVLFNDGTFQPTAGATGQIIIDFDNGNSIASNVVTGQSAIVSTSVPRFYVLGTSSTSTHNQTEHQLADILFSLSCSNINVGTGFTVTAISKTGILRGAWLVNWIWS